MNPLEILNNNTSVIALLGVLATVITNYVIQKTKTEVDTYTVDRNTLSEDQREFTHSILEELKECKATVDKLRDENDKLHTEALDHHTDRAKLKLQIIHLQDEIADLRATIERIMKKVGADLDPPEINV